MKESTYNLTTNENEKSVCLFTLIKGIRTTWEIGSTCNLGCKHCCIAAKSKSDDKLDLDIEKAKEVIKEIAKIGVKTIYISGGEPLLWRPFPEFIKYAKFTGIDFLSMATNGTLINPDTANLLKDAGIDKVLISLDSHRKEIHDEIRGKPGVYEKVIDAIKYLKEKGIFVRIGTVIWSGNVNEIEDMTDSMYKLGADEIAFSWLMKSGRAIEHPEIFVSQERYSEVGMRLNALKKKWKDKMLISFHRFNDIDDDYLGCQGSIRFLHIDPEGHLSPCSWITKLCPHFVSKGTIHTKSVFELLQEKPLKDFRTMVKERESEYGPGCPAICMIESKNLYEKDPLYKGQK